MTHRLHCLFLAPPYLIMFAASLSESTNNNITMNSNIDRAESPDVSPPGYVNILPEITEQPQQPYDEDDHSGEIREYNGVFEGPEKTLGKGVNDFECFDDLLTRTSSHHPLSQSQQRLYFASYPVLKAI